ncbi:MAG TPA: Wadjet anti-phage system protein JetD domain-containing protein [Terrimicrobiaceae bacterium]
MKTPREMAPEDRFLDSLRVEAAGAARLDLDQIQRAFSTTFPHFDGSPNRRAKLREMLDALAAGQLVRLPADRKRAWQNQPAPALPLRLALVRETADKPARFDHQRFPWVRELAFIAELPLLHTPEEARHLHDFFKNGGASSPFVPTKERSWQIFGKEKRLNDLQHGQLFDVGRLTLELLRCRNVTQILAFSCAPIAVSAPMLIVENESTFHSFCRLNHQLSIYAGVVFGDGNTVLKAVDYLRDLAQATGVTVVHYFGDLDPRGLRIACVLGELMKQCNLSVLPADELYRALLTAPPPAERHPQPADEESLTWLPAELRDAARDRLASFGRIAQEAVGWERLCALHNADPHSPFSLGFTPRPKDKSGSPIPFT